MQYRIRLSTLLLIVSAVCCFFAGQRWNSIEAIKAGTSELLVVEDGKHFLLTMPKMISEVHEGDPKVLRVTPLSQYEILLYGVDPGQTELVVMTLDKKITTFSVKVPGKESVVVNSYSSGKNRDITMR